MLGWNSKEHKADQWLSMIISFVGVVGGLHFCRQTLHLSGFFVVWCYSFYIMLIPRLLTRKWYTWEAILEMRHQQWIHRVNRKKSRQYNIVWCGLTNWINCNYMPVWFRKLHLRIKSWRSDIIKHYHAKCIHNCVQQDSRVDISQILHWTVDKLACVDDTIICVPQHWLHTYTRCEFLPFNIFRSLLHACDSWSQFVWYIDSSLTSVFQLNTWREEVITNIA